MTRSNNSMTSAEETSYPQEEADPTATALRLPVLSPSSSSPSIVDQQHYRAYQPKAFEEVVGHEMITTALRNAVRRKKISPLYLFRGPGGTGKTSTARIFAALLNCTSATPSPRPCWACAGCSSSLRASQLRSGNIRSFLQSSPSNPRVFIFDLRASDTGNHWEELLDIIAEQEEARTSSPVVFVLVTEDASALPKRVVSQCHKFSFSKLKDADVVLKLSRIVAHEQIEISEDALQLVARKADGNLREAENLLDQLALLEANITASTVQQLAGLVPHERLVRLLEAALSGRSAEAARCTRDLIDCGMEPRSLISQLSTLVVEILAGVHLSSPPSSDKLNEALKVLMETEKQMMISPCNHTTWITGAVLQIASVGVTNTTVSNLKDNNANPNADFRCINMEELWHGILARIHNRRIREFLQRQTKILSLTVSRANAIVHLMVKHPEEVPEDMTDTLKVALGCPVTVNVSREPPALDVHKAPQNLDSSTPFSSQDSAPDFQSRAQMALVRTRRDSIFVDPTPDRSRNVQCLDTDSVGRANEIMDRLLLMPSLPQMDTSIEPYSQDLLFEEAKNQRQQGQRCSKLHREFLQAKQHPHNMTYTHSGLNRSWSCRERLCRDESMVNEDMVDLATKRHVLKWVNPCKESDVVNSTVHKGQPDLRKTVPASPASCLQ